MAKRPRGDEDEERAAARGSELVLPVDHTNEQVVLAAAAVDREARQRLLRLLPNDAFLVDESRAAWAVLREMEQRNLAYDPATFQRLAGDRVRADYVSQLVELRPEAPSNIGYHVDALLWDRQKANAAKGPLTSLLEVLQSPNEPPERARALARHLAEALAGRSGAGKHLHDPRSLVQAQVAEIERRITGHAAYPYGIPGLDVFEPGATDARGRDVGGTRRMIPGAAPGQVTVVTATSGGGKTTLSAHLVLGLTRQRRRGMYCAWEPQAGMALEIMACISLGMSRTRLIQGILEREEVVQLEERMHALSRWVVFMENPFRRQVGSKARNQHNLDILQEHIATSGAEWVICDLWERCLVDTDPNDEKEALFRQQAMAIEQAVHVVMLAQQRSKDIETRADKRPTREGIKGSSAWVDVADTIIGVHRPGQWKKIADDKLEAFILKQRYGMWPLGVEFDWDLDMGSILGGRSIEYDQPGEAGVGGFGAEFREPEGMGKKMGRGRGRGR